MKHGEAIDPDRPIIDAHHHLWDTAPQPGYPEFPLSAFDRTVRESGHNIVASVYVESGTSPYASGPEHLRPCGETEYAAGCAARSEALGMNVARGLVTHVDLHLEQEPLAEQLARHVALGGSRLRGVRHMSAWDENPHLRFGLHEGALRQPAIHRALQQVAAAGLSFDAWMHYHQLPDLVCAMEAVPELQVVLDHAGGILLAPDADRLDRDVFARWQVGIDALARFPNISVKLGGLFLGPAMRLSPQGTAGDLAEICRPWFDHILDRFGAARCMFESNFPVDAGSLTYTMLWNAFKIYADGFAETAKNDLFFSTANRAYRLGL